MRSGCCPRAGPEPQGAGAHCTEHPAEGLKSSHAPRSHAAWGEGSAGSPPAGLCLSGGRSAFSLICTEAWCGLTEALAAGLSLKMLKPQGNK